MKTVRLSSETKNNLLAGLLKRTTDDYGDYEKIVKDIVADVHLRGDEAVFEYTKKFDKADINESNIRVTDAEIEEAYNEVDKELLEVVRRAIKNIKDFHAKQKRNTWITTEDTGVILGQRVSPVEYAGVYVPGGKAAYPSTVLMNVIPAQVAGVPNIVMTTPCNAEGKVYPMTLAALAYGTKSIPKVDKIVGPGNIFVALAKRLCYGHVSIDSIAGPSEILVLADETANPEFVAADLLSQAEHDELASATLVTTSEKLAEEVSVWVDKFTAELERKEIIEKSLENFGVILVADNMQDAIDAANEIAPEHMEIVTANPWDIMTKIKNAGAIFLGAYSSEPLGDYFAGPNHILPTNRTARFFSPLNVDDFMKKTSIISYSRDALSKVHEDIELFAKEEGLTAHANSIAVRFE